jgi:pilus assembly protein CpaE
MEDASLIREDHLQRVIGLLRASYTHLILDLSKSLSPNDMTALKMADIILLVAQLELSSLRNVVRLLLSLGNDPDMADKIRIVLNRVGSDSDINPKKAEETIGKPVFWQIPNEQRMVSEARDQGAPLIQLAPRCKVQQAIAGLAQALTGKAPAPEKSSRWALFSRK